VSAVNPDEIDADGFGVILIVIGDEIELHPFKSIT
jgi:hypothetical protein